MSSEDKKEIEAVMILEVIGKPKEHLVETLNEIVEKIKKEQGVVVTKSSVNEPIEMEGNKEFFTTFAEVEVKTEGILHLIRLMFGYMPAHIDIIYPEKFSLTNNHLGEMLSELIRRLHGYDEVARILQFENKMLQSKLQELMPKEKIVDGKIEVVEEKKEEIVKEKKKGKKRKENIS